MGIKARTASPNTRYPSGRCILWNIGILEYVTRGHWVVNRTVLFSSVVRRLKKFEQSSSTSTGRRDSRDSQPSNSVVAAEADFSSASEASGTAKTTTSEAPEAAATEVAAEASTREAAKS